MRSTERALLRGQEPLDDTAGLSACRMTVAWLLKVVKHGFIDLIV